MPKIDITKAYQTRIGTKVRLISDQGSAAYPIVGYIGNDINPASWNANGYYCTGSRAIDNDLIPAPQTIKTLPYRRFISQSEEGYYVTVMIQDPSEPNQIHQAESARGFTRWLDADWITTSFDLHI